MSRGVYRDDQQQSAAYRVNDTLRKIGTSQAAFVAVLERETKAFPEGTMQRALLDGIIADYAALTEKHAALTQALWTVAALQKSD